MKKSSFYLAHPIKDYMTHSPHVIGKEEPLAEASEKMRVHDVRHLPVLDGEKLVGILSERDLFFIETFKSVDPRTTPVQAAMNPDTYAVSPETTLREVVKTMANHKYGSAVVFRNATV